MADKYRCPVCLKDVAPTQAGKFRKHNKDDGAECDMSGVYVPEHVKAHPSDSSDVPVKGRDYADCPACGRTPRLNQDGKFGLHKIVSGGSENCPTSGKPYQVDGADQELTSAESIAAGEDIEQWRERRNRRLGATQSQESTTTQQDSTEHESQPGETCPPMQTSPPSAPTQDDTAPCAPPTRADAQDSSSSRQEHAPASAAIEFRQPAPPFEQPGRTSRVLVETVPMTDMGREIAARLKETFHAYSNRLARNTQTSLGPSEIGTPCDRRIAMHLLQVPPVNPGGDNWASFVGTCVHQGLADMFLWADANTGRYAVEVPLQFPNALVPRGTGDLLDRTLLMFLDHKLMGRWSLDKLSTKGPSATYRVQVHTYAYGARLKGEKVDYVAIIGWPRESSVLDDLYVWTERYDPTIAIQALERVERIAKSLPADSLAADRSTPEAARQFGTADDCRFCPFYAPGDAQGERGCNGR